MSKINSYTQDIYQTDDYKFGWESAERGEPRPYIDNDIQKLGWDDFHNNERQS